MGRLKCLVVSVSKSQYVCMQWDEHSFKFTVSAFNIIVCPWAACIYVMDTSLVRREMFASLNSKSKNLIGTFLVDKIGINKMGVGKIP